MSVDVETRLVGNKVVILAGGRPTYELQASDLLRCATTEERRRLAVRAIRRIRRQAVDFIPNFEQ